MVERIVALALFCAACADTPTGNATGDVSTTGATGFGPNPDTWSWLCGGASTGDDVECRLLARVVDDSGDVDNSGGAATLSAAATRICERPSRGEAQTSTAGRFAIARSTASRGYSKSSSFPARYWSYAARSKCPWPDRLKRITRVFPSASAFFASSMAPLIACELSGAGMIPSDRANVTAASKQARCG